MSLHPGTQAMAALLCHMSHNCETEMWLLSEHLEHRDNPYWAHKQCLMFKGSHSKVQLHVVEGQMGKRKISQKLLHNKEDTKDSQVRGPLKSFTV